ncbi:hypothetical protein WSM22_35320 [Cytophagales bacterium WSM2-2]|nr:hypothetical protein WSM22_35320 [Cytophagales bacterium WSM2-2]
MASGHAFFQDSLIEVDSKLSRVLPALTGGKVLIPLVLEDSAQAGSGGTLHANPGFSKKPYLVYYSIFTDKTLFNYADSMRKVLQADTLQLNNLYTFPIHSLELKISWVDVNSIPPDQQASYYATDAAIKIGKGYKLIRVALLGMHVVGRVINHPEFIWATFEHQTMAPLYNWSATTLQQDAPITSGSGTLLFAKGTTTGLGGITWNNNTRRPDSLYRAYSLYKYGVPRVAYDSFMTGTSQSEPINYNNIDGLNTCVAAGLANTDVWRNYFYNGSIWINTDGLTEQQQAKLIDSLNFNIGNVTTGSSARGSLNGANLTMETFVQTGAQDSINNIHKINLGDLVNCLSCHTGGTNLTMNKKTFSDKKSPLYMSHIFKNSLDTKTTITEAKRQGILHFLKMQERKKGVRRR